MVLGLHGHQQVLERFPEPRRNLRPEAVATAQQYMDLYRDDCGSAPAVAPVAVSNAANPPATEDDWRLNQIYTVTRYGSHIIAGTQQGVVVWQPGQSEHVAHYNEFICGHVVVHGDSAWAGCDTRVLRWNGRDWKTYLHNPDNDAEYYATRLGPRGQLMVFYGSTAWEYDGERDTFKETSIPHAGAYDLIFRSNGQMWWIDFLSSLHSEQQSYSLESIGYPGADPRKFFEDERGRLWVQDFRSGLLLYDDATRRFTLQPGLSDKGSGVAVDTTHDRVWMLHYTDGLTLLQGGKIVKRLDLGHLEYMRNMHLDDNGDVWVGGWTELVRVYLAEGSWQTESYKIP